MTQVLAIDLGGTQLRAAVSSGDPASLRDLTREPAPASLADFTGRLAALRAEVGDVTAIGLAVPGLVENTQCRWIPNLPYLDGLDIAALFPDLQIGLGNDAQISLLAEAEAGAARGTSDAILLAIGTGIGSAVLANGRIVAGARGGACSFGWACADMDDPGEDRSGWLERMAAGRALDDIAIRLGKANGAELIAAAREGDSAAITALQKPVQSLGMALAGAVALLDPEVILIAGGISAALDVLGQPVLDAMRRQLPAHLRPIEIRAGTFGARAGIVGAALAGAAGQNWRQIR
ncbi:ROK family protein [Mesorhizobium sp. CGMCC 1.15528]|uniref:ROK family protein n=1 Tax=Mesorhizobium zhangyense TaxID=1776730 RepID=A0A7C9VGC2_9HYPH|nr:ROK family protein [Mesorhizobium zhangyense]NGN44769.1 ROK family protein [Mesorhizobium zhangyense]